MHSFLKSARPHKLLITAGAVSLALLTTVAAQPQGKKGKAKSPPPLAKLQCPVVGAGNYANFRSCPGGYCSRKPNKSLTIKHNGGTVMFCCGGCVKRFRKDTKKYAAFANHQLVATRQAVQVACPMCKGKLGDGASHNVAGLQVRFCSEACAKRVVTVKDMKRKIEMVFGSSTFAKGFRVNGAQVSTNAPAESCCCRCNAE